MFGDDRGREAEQAQNDCEQRLGNTVLGYASYELRPDAVADGEQEHQEEH